MKLPKTRKRLTRKRFQVFKLVGNWHSLVDVIRNATVASFSTKEEAMDWANEMNLIQREKEN